MYEENSRLRIEPFWHRFPYFFTYPAAPTLLPATVGLSLAIALSPLGLFGSLLDLCSLLVFLRVAYAVLELRADGQSEPPRLDNPIFRGGYSLPFKQWLVLLALVSLVLVAERNLGQRVGLLVTIVVTLALPASVIVLASTHRILDAANPLLLVRMMVAIGFPYLGVFVLLLLLNAASLTASGWLAQRLPGFFGEWAVGFVGFHYALSMFLLMGYLVYQYHDRLGLRPSVPAVRDGSVESPAWLRYRRFMVQENYPAAAEALRSLMAQDPDNLEYPQLMHRLLSLTADPAAHDHAAGLLDRLVAAGKVAQAAELVEDSRAENAPLLPAQGESHLPLAQALRQRGSQRQALALISGFHRRHPDHIDTAELYLLAAQIYAEDQDDDTAALKVLDFAIRLLPADPAVQALKFYRSGLSV